MFFLVSNIKHNYFIDYVKKKYRYKMFERKMRLIFLIYKARKKKDLSNSKLDLFRILLERSRNSFTSTEEYKNNLQHTNLPYVVLTLSFDCTAK